MPEHSVPAIRETEASVERKIIQLAELVGFRLLCKSSQGFRPGGKGHGTTRITTGFPDLLFGHPVHKVLVFVEVKSPGGRLRQSQRAWHAMANGCGARVWTCHSLDEFKAYLDLFDWLGPA